MDRCVNLQCACIRERSVAQIFMTVAQAVEKLTPAISLKTLQKRREYQQKKDLRQVASPFKFGGGGN